MTPIESLGRPVEEFVNHGVVDPALIHDEFTIARAWGQDSNALDLKLRRFTANDQFQACRFSVGRFQPLERLMNLTVENPHSFLGEDARAQAGKFLGTVWQQSVLFAGHNLPVLDQYVFDGVTRMRALDEVEAQEDIDFRADMQAGMFDMIQQLNQRAGRLDEFNAAASHGGVYNPDPQSIQFHDGTQALQTYWQDLAAVKATTDGNYATDLNALRLVFGRANFLYEIIRRDQVKEGGLPLITNEMNRHRQSAMGCYKRMVVYHNWGKMCERLSDMVQEPC